ncbi:MAG TPA: helix-turn-helix domain-containing protein [Planctomycetota bacterium]|nr:helix-turn-helix domain-containing protein [Planctomycetota bacterium]
MTETLASVIPPAPAKKRAPRGPRSRGPRSFAVDIRTGLAPNEKEILNLDEAAAFLGVSLRTFLKTLRLENLPGRKVGREWKFSRSALVAWIGSGRTRDFLRNGGGEEGREGRGPGARGEGTRSGRRRRDDIAAEED